MKLQEKIDAFAQLGKFFLQFASISFQENKDLNDVNSRFKKKFKQLINITENYNPWFTPEFIRLSLASWGNALKKDNINIWVNQYPHLQMNNKNSLKIGIVMAGNIPLVGFHDLISVLFSGHLAHIKLSSKDDKLIPIIIRILEFLNHEFEDLITIREEKLNYCDAYIATGSNNSSRYFQYYFGKYPNIIRKNRNSAGVLTGNESESDLRRLADDIFSYFGLGCRNVSKIFIPKNFHIPDLLPFFQHYDYLINHNKYANNYMYYRSVYMVNKINFFDNGFLLCKEDSTFSSQVGCLFYEHYDRLDQLNDRIMNESDKIQCVVSRDDQIKNRIDFGKTQEPQLWDYPDNIDTLKFLINL